MRTQDLVAVEEPLQIRLDELDVAITMRTPGHDRELALGFLYTEGLVAKFDQIAAVRVGDSGAVIVSLVAGLAPDIDVRRFYVTSKLRNLRQASIDALAAAGCAMLPAGQPTLSANLVPHFPARLREAQAIFEHTADSTQRACSQLLASSCICAKTWAGTTPSTN